MEKEALITLTHREYQALLHRQRIIPMANLTVSEKRALERTRRQMAQGDFVTLDELKHELVGQHRR